MGFIEAETAKDWGLTPKDWYEEPRWSRATMIATRQTRAAIDYWIAEDAPKP